MLHSPLTRLARGPLARWLGAVALCTSLGAAQAASFTLTGSFTQDDQVALFTLTLDSADTLNVRSLGYAGGTDTNGVQRLAGGFDTMAFLYNAGGTLIAQSDDGVGVATDPVTGLAADAAFSIALPAGQYTLALTQYDNFALGALSAGFSQAGTGNFTPGMSPTCTASSFCDWSGASRTGQWALAITGVSAVPEPGSFALMLGGAIGLLALRRRRAA